MASLEAAESGASFSEHTTHSSEQSLLPYKLFSRGTYENRCTTYSVPDHVWQQMCTYVAGFYSRKEVLDKMQIMRLIRGVYDLDSAREFLHHVFRELESNQGLYRWWLGFLHKRGASDSLLSELTKIYNNRIVTIDQYGKHFGLSGAASLSNDLKRHSAFTCISFTNCDIGDKGCAALAEGLVGCKTLESLKLIANNICDDGAVYLASIFKSEIQIGCFTINDNQIGDIGALALANVLQQFDGLESLDLRYNLIGDEGVQALTRNVKKDVHILLWNQKLSFFTPSANESFGILELSKSSISHFQNLLGHSNYLHTINFDGESIDSEDVMSFVETLKNSYCLKSLFLENMHMNFSDSFDDDYEDIFQGSLDHCSDLHTCLAANLVDV